MKALLGIDLGTQSAKAILLREDGQLLGSSNGKYPILTPSVGYAEQEPSSWWLAVTGVIRSLLKETGIDPLDIAGIGFSGQMHGMVPLDESGEVIRPAIIWCDQRSNKYVDFAYEKIGKDKLGRITLNPLSAGFQLASLLWMRDNEPEKYQRISNVILPKDYIRYRLTGSIGSEFTDASSTLLLDTSERQWSDDIIETLGLTRSHFPELTSPLKVVGNVTPLAAAETGLVAGTPVIAGGSDQPMQALGDGITEPGTILITTGTGGQLFTIVNQPIYNPKLNTHTFCNVIPETWYVLAATLSAGLSLSWFTSSIAHVQDYDLLNAEAANVPVGSEGLFFLPYLIGERAPHFDSEARAQFYGLTLKHNRAHMIRAIMEGVAYSYRDCLAIMKDLGIRIEKIVASGGGTRSPLWMQIQSDVLGREIHVSERIDQACYGAAISAGIGVGVFPDIPTACKRLLHGKDNVIIPDLEHHRIYDKGYMIYRDLYEHTRSFGKRVNEFIP